MWGAGMKLNVDKPTTVKFVLEVQNMSPDEASVRLLINGNKGFALSFPGRVINGEAIIDLPPADGILDGGQASAVLEVISKGYYFKPWEGTVEIDDKPVISVRASVSESRVSAAEALDNSADVESVLESILTKRKETKEVPSPVVETSTGNVVNMLDVAGRMDRARQARENIDTKPQPSILQNLNLQPAQASGSNEPSYLPEDAPMPGMNNLLQGAAARDLLKFVGKRGSSL